jgi:hypothetical protein
MRLDLQGRILQFPAEEKLGETQIDETERTVTTFHDPESTTVADLVSNLAWSEKPSTPELFPLSFCWWLRAGEKVGFVSASAEVQRAIKAAQLSWARDAEDQGILVLEFRGERNTMRWWVDTARGFLVIRSRWSLVADKPVLTPQGMTRDVLIEETTCSPKKFDGHWFIDHGRRTYYRIDRQAGPNAPVVYLYKQENVAISSFRPHARFGAGDLEFSAQRYPSIKRLIDRQQRLITEPSTGEITPMPK